MPTDPSFSVRCTLAQRKVIAELLPSLVVRLKLDEKNQRAIPFSVGELKTVQQRAKTAIGKAKGGMEQNSLRHIVDAVTKALDESEGIGSIPASERLYQFKITLLESKPLIWRRIQVKNGTLDKLHEHIQTAIGWTNSHLHQFRINGERYGDPDLLECGEPDFGYIDSTVTRISEVVPKDGKRFSFLYEYDFGDDWQHEVIFEGCLPAEKGERYPVCVEGERACPPEDVGGVWGYVEYLEALADPKHERHKEFMQWRGPFDPDEFDPRKATFEKIDRGVAEELWDHAYAVYDRACKEAEPESTADENQQLMQSYLLGERRLK